MFQRVSKRVVLSSFAASLALGVSCGSMPAHAGFLDQLFGVQSAPEPQPYIPPAPAYNAPESLDQVLPRPAHRVHRRIADSKPVRQKTTDLMHDASLRPGDAVMMKDGIHVFEGDAASEHSKDEFVDLRDADGVSRKEKVALASVDTTRNDPLRHGVQPDTIASGRSASVSAPIVQGVKIVDARGATVRYVGP